MPSYLIFVTGTTGGAYGEKNLSCGEISPRNSSPIFSIFETPLVFPRSLPQVEFMTQKFKIRKLLVRKKHNTLFNLVNLIDFYQYVSENYRTWSGSVRF